MTASVPLTRGYSALVDDADYGNVTAAGPWYVVLHRRTAYARRNIRRSDGTRATQRLHNFLTGWPFVDHRDGNGLNNQRENLRPATKGQNTVNTPPAVHNTSGYKGVAWYPRSGCWRAQAGSGRRTFHLGYFDAAKDAALAYDAAASLMWGEYAWLNLPEELTDERIEAARQRLAAAGVSA